MRTKKERGGRNARAEGEGAWIFIRASLPDSQMRVVRPVLVWCWGLELVSRGGGGVFGRMRHEGQEGDGVFFLLCVVIQRNERSRWVPNNETRERGVCVCRFDRVFTCPCGGRSWRRGCAGRRGTRPRPAARKTPLWEVLGGEREGALGGGWSQREKS